MNNYLNTFCFTIFTMDWQTKEYVEERFDELNDKLDQVISKLGIKSEDEEDDDNLFDDDDENQDDSKDFDV